MTNKFDNCIRITYYGNYGTIYSVIQNNPLDDSNNFILPTSGEWIYPFDDENIECLIDAVIDICGNAFLDNEAIYKVIISNDVIGDFNEYASFDKLNS